MADTGAAEPSLGRKLGPTGRRVCRNLKSLRGRVPVRELSKQLKELGRPILPSGITKIETGERRVDVDDLMALALVLGVTPNRLLLEPGVEGSMSLTNEVEVTGSQGWHWATGSLPLPTPVGSLVENEPLSSEVVRAFHAQNRPNEPLPGSTLDELMELGNGPLAPLAAAAAQAVQTGDVTPAQVGEFMNFWRIMVSRASGTGEVIPAPRASQ